MHLMGIRAVEDDSRMKQVIEEHRMLFFPVLKEGNPQKAFSALIDHLENTEKILIAENIETVGKK